MHRCGQGFCNLRCLNTADAVAALKHAGESQTAHEWTCDVCKCPVVAKTAAGIPGARWWRINRFDKNVPKARLKHLTYDGPAVSPLFGGAPGEWQCGFCLQGLPLLPGRQWCAPARRHLREVHHGASLADSNRALCERLGVYIVRKGCPRVCGLYHGSELSSAP